MNSLAIKYKMPCKALLIDLDSEPRTLRGFAFLHIRREAQIHILACGDHFIYHKEKERKALIMVVSISCLKAINSSVVTYTGIGPELFSICIQKISISPLCKCGTKWSISYYRWIEYSRLKYVLWKMGYGIFGKHAEYFNFENLYKFIHLYKECTFLLYHDDPYIDL